MLADSNPPNMKKSLIIIAAALAVGVATAAVQRQVRPTTSTQHPNLTAAQKLVQQAYDKLTASVKAQEGDVAGHTELAKSYLQQANAEIKLAIEVAETTNGAR